MNELHAIAVRIGEIRKIRDDIDEEEKGLWKRVFEIADDIAGVGESYRYNDLELNKTIGREMHQQAPRINVERLQASLDHEQWLMVTRQERVLDSTKLEKAIETELVPKDVVVGTTEFPSAIPHKKFGEIAKKDLQ